MRQKYVNMLVMYVNARCCAKQINSMHAGIPAEMFKQAYIMTYGAILTIGIYISCSILARLNNVLENKLYQK